jgi:hypothetical protein
MNGDDIASKLRGKYNINAVSLGTGGNSPVHYLALLRTFDPKIQSRNLAVIFYANDNVINDYSSAYYGIFVNKDAEYLIPDSSTIFGYRLNPKLNSVYTKSEFLINAIIAKPPVTNSSFSKALLNLMTLPNLRGFLRAIHQSLSSELSETTRGVIDYIGSAGGSQRNVFLVYIPNNLNYDPQLGAINFKNNLHSYAKIKGIPFIDLSNDIALLGNAAYSPVGPHLSPLGYELVSNAINKQVNLMSK